MSDAKDKPATSSDGPRWAADEPTAMWDESSLRDAGYDEVAKKKVVETAPATAPDVRGQDAANVHASSAGNVSARPPAPAGISWALTFLVAGVVGVAVYFLVRLLR